MKFFEVEMFQGDGNMAMKKKISVNPEYIAYIEDDDTAHAFIHMSTKSILHTVESRDAILQLIKATNAATYVK